VKLSGTRIITEPHLKLSF